MDHPIVGFAITDEDRKKVKFKDLCGKCKNVLRNALQTSCGHRYCSECLEREFIKGLAICIVCQERLTRDKVFRDKFADREVQALVLSCLYFVFGCKWMGELRSREEHQKSCNFMPISCIYLKCDKKFPREQLVHHLEEQCLYREQTCSYCERPIVVAFAKEHEQQCPSIPVICQSCNNELPRSELANHRDPNSVDVCTALSAPCPFVALGCYKKKSMNHEERQAHLQKNIEKHINLLLSKVLLLSGAYPGDLIPAAQNKTNNGKRMPELTLLHDEMISEMASVKKDLELRILQVEERIGGIGFGSMSASGYGETAIQDLARRIDNSDAKSASHELLLNEAHSTIEKQQKELARMQKKIVKLEKRLADQKQIAELRNLAIADLEEKLRYNTGCSYDGILLLKITQVARKRADAVSGRQISFYSPAFYTDPHGYKMCARIYLNGDGMGKGTHISLFFVIMRGEYDALLQWPFRQKVTMMLLDQDHEEHVIDAFRPDPNSSSFQKPRGEMNVASGCPLFCPHSELQSHAYIRDDTMFIKVIVDTTIDEPLPAREQVPLTP